MNRREFLIFAGIGTIAAVVAPKMLAECSVPPPGWRCTRGGGHDGPCAAVPTETIEWTPSHAYKMGDVVKVSGFSDSSLNGEWLVMDSHRLGKMA